MAVKKFEVINVGTDTSGRTIWMTRYMKAFIDAVKFDWRVAPFADKLVIVQGAFMTRNGGGASASAGYHDLAGCIDFRDYNLTEAERDTFCYVARCYGGAAWYRDAEHGGFDAHIHITLGGDYPLSNGARTSWISYQEGDNGLTGSSAGPDYVRRPNPFVTSYTGPVPFQEDELNADDKQWIKNQFDDLQHRLFAARSGSAERDKKLREHLAQLDDAVAKLPKTAASKKDVEDALKSLRLVVDVADETPTS